MIVVDTTVWIDFFAARETKFDRHLRALITDGAPVALTDIIYCEVVQGVRDDVQYRRTRDRLLAFPILRVRGLQTFDRAAAIYRAGRKRGVTIRKTVDCIIAATCIRAHAELFHNDRDFDAISGVAPLQIHHPGV